MKVRITKYDPKLRNRDGVFTGRNWTSVSDIGKYPNLTTEEYLLAEDGYWRTLASIFESLDIRELRIGSLDFHDRQPINDRLSSDSWQFCRNLTLKELSNCGMEVAEKLVRAALREVIWFRAYGVDGHDFRVEFGYDFYMYFVSDDDFKWANVPGIFVEEMPEEELE